MTDIFKVKFKNLCQKTKGVLNVKKKCASNASDLTSFCCSSSDNYTQHITSFRHMVEPRDVAPDENQYLIVCDTCINSMSLHAMFSIRM